MLPIRIASLILVASLYYCLFGCSSAGDVTFGSCGGSSGITVTALNVEDGDPTVPDLCSLTGCTILADHSYTIRVDVCLNSSLSLPILALPFQVNGLVTVDGTQPLVYTLPLQAGNLCNNFGPTSAISSCPITTVTACATFIINIPCVPYVRTAVSDVGSGAPSPAVINILVWKDTQGTSAQAIACINSPITYQLS